MHSGLDNKLVALRIEYLEKLPERVDEIVRILVPYMQHPADRALANEVIYLTDKLAGSASTFGFMDVAYYCQRIEKIVKEASADEYEEQVRVLAKLQMHLQQAVISFRDSDYFALVGQKRIQQAL